MSEVFNQSEEHRRFFRSHPEFIITRRASNASSDHEPLLYIEPSDVLKPDERTDSPSIENRVIAFARAKADEFIEVRGGIVEIWHRVGCFKATKEDWA